MSHSIPMRFKSSSGVLKPRHGYFIILIIATLPAAFIPPADSTTHSPMDPPGYADYPISPVYIDDIQWTFCDARPFIRIEGHLPTPCHQLAPPAQQEHGDTLIIDLASWHKADVSCAQVLEPFIYYHPVSTRNITDPVRIRVNDTTISP
ncbi:MAG: hypothetical protein WD097_00950 [Balneolales bacterium]